MTSVTIPADGPAEAPSLVDRAISAYYRMGLPQQLGQPSPTATHAAESGGKRYVVVCASDNVVLTVYRVRNDGVLKRLQRWPSELAPSASSTLPASAARERSQ
jgi:hypothetical protein